MTDFYISSVTREECSTDKILESLNKQLQENNKKLKNILTAIENGIFNNTTGQRMQELENSKKELEEKIAGRLMLTIKPLDENQVYSYLLSFKDLDYLLENAKQRLVDMFVNRVILFDDHCEIYFNVSDDKGEQLKLTEQPDIESEIEIKKNNPNPKGSDYYHMAGNF